MSLRRGLVHIDPELAPRSHVAIEFEIPNSLHIRRIAPRRLPRNWRRYPAPRRLQDLGTAWVRSGVSAVLSVPSAVVVSERNFLINPAHHDARRIVVRSRQPFRFDPRLI